MRYTVKRISYTLYDLANELGQPSGCIQFNTWSMSKAKATIAHQEYDLYSVGFWQTKKVMARDGILLAEMEYRLGKGFDISLQGHGRLFFRKKSFWTTSEYILADENGTTFGTLKMKYNWKGWTYNYDIEIHNAMFNAELKSIMPVIMFYTSIIMLRKRQAAG